MAKRVRAQARHIGQSIIKKAAWAMKIANSGDGEKADEEEAEAEGEEEEAEVDEGEEEAEQEEEEEEEQPEKKPSPKTTAKRPAAVPVAASPAKRPAAAVLVAAVAAKKPATSPSTGLDWQYGYDSEHRMAYRMLAKRGAKRDWATELEAPTPTGSENVDDMYPVAVFVDGSKYSIPNISWGDHQHALAVRPAKGKLWEDVTAKTYLALKKDRQLLLILYQTPETGSDRQIVQVAVKHFGDPALQVTMILKP